MPDPLAGLPLAGLPLASSTDIATLLEALQATSPGLLDQLKAGGALPGLQGVGAQVNAPPVPVAQPSPGAQTQAQQAQAASQTLTPTQQSVLPQAIAAVQTAMGLGGAVQKVGQAGVTPSSVAGLAGPVLDTAAIAAELLKANPDLVLALKAGADAAPIVSKLLSPAFRQVLAGGSGLGGALTAGAGLAGLGANLGGTLAKGLGAPNELSFGLQQAGALAGGIGALSSIASQGAAQAAASAAPAALGSTLGPAIGGASLGQGLGALLSIPGTVAWFMDAQARADERRRMGNQAGAMFQELRAKGLPRAQQGFMQMLQGNLGGADAVAEVMQDLIRVEFFARQARGSVQGTGIPELRQNIMQSVARLGPRAFDAVVDRLVARADQPSVDKFQKGMGRMLVPGETRLVGNVPAIAQWLGTYLGERPGLAAQPTIGERFYGMAPQGSRYARPAAAPASRALTAADVAGLPRQSLQQAMQDPRIVEYLRRMG
jgi:hypothetical protein